MNPFRCKTHFKVAALITGMAFSGLSFTASAAGLTNGDFSSGFTGWSGDISAGPVDLASPSDNFDASTGAAVMSTSYFTTGDYMVDLFQTFDLSSTAQTLSFDYSWVADDATDTWQAQLVDISDPNNHFLTFTTSAPGSGKGQFDLTGFSDLTVQLLFGLENMWGGDGIEDTLTVDNIVIAERQPNGVPEPSTLLLMTAGLIAIRRKFYFVLTRGQPLSASMLTLEN